VESRRYKVFYLGNQGFGGNQGYGGNQGFGGNQGYGGTQGWGNPGVYPGYGNPSSTTGFGGNTGDFGGMQQQPGMIQLGMQGGIGFNTWGNTGTNYQQMNGFQAVDYSGGWNANVHDQMLRAKIEQIYMRYDMNQSGSLEGN